MKLRYELQVTQRQIPGHCPVSSVATTRSASLARLEKLAANWTKNAHYISHVIVDRETVTPVRS